MAGPTATNPWAWYKADALVLADGDPIATWTDSSGNGRDGTGGVGTERAIYKTGILNSLPVARFDSTVQPIITLPSMAAVTAGTVFVVVKVNNDPPADINHSGLWKFGTSASDCHFPYTDSNVYDDFGSTVRKSTGDPTLSLSSNFRIYEVVTQAGEWTSYIDRTQHFTTATNTVGFAATPTLGRSVTGYSLDGDLAEFIVYDSALTGTTRTDVEDYLYSKWFPVAPNTTVTAQGPGPGLRGPGAEDRGLGYPG